MKRFGLIVTLISSFMFPISIMVPFNSCDLVDVKDEENEDDNALTNLTMLTLLAGHDFTDQDLQGKIGGVDWTYQSGKAAIWGSDTGTLHINIYSSAPSGGDECGGGAYASGANVVMTSVPNEVQLNQLSFSIQNITLYDGQTNNIAVQGAIEILSINTSGNVTGRIDARADADNYVNGNFTIKYCQ